MAGVVGGGGGGSVPSLPPPRPKSPPEYPDLYGKRRELAKVQRLEREIGFLEEEMKSIEGLQPASRSCKEVADFVMGNVDPLIPTTKKIRRSQRFWKWLCGVSCLDVSWICCCWSPSCCKCTLCSCSNPCRRCRMPKCNCCSSSSCCCWNSKCFSKSTTCTCSWINCCAPKCPSCLITCSSLRCKCYPNCPKVNTSSTSSICSCFCNKSCCCSCYPCYFCY